MFSMKGKAAMVTVAVECISCIAELIGQQWIATCIWEGANKFLKANSHVLKKMKLSALW